MLDILNAFLNISELQISKFSPAMVDILNAFPPISLTMSFIVSDVGMFYQKYGIFWENVVCHRSVIALFMFYLRNNSTDIDRLHILHDKFTHYRILRFLVASASRSYLLLVSGIQDQILGAPRCPGSTYNVPL